MFGAGGNIPPPDAPPRYLTRITIEKGRRRRALGILTAETGRGATSQPPQWISRDQAVRWLSAPSSGGSSVVSMSYACLPDDLVLTNYFGVRDGKIVSLVIVFNQPADY
jgi:hypothetical protein